MDSDRDSIEVPDAAASLRQTAASKKWQFSLGALFSGTLVICLILGFLVNSESVYRVEFRCSQLPATDEGLAAWYEKQEGVANVQVIREGKHVRVEYSKRQIFANFDHLLPPLRDLGYTSHGMSLSGVSHSPFSGVANTLWSLRWPLIVVVMGAFAILLVSWGWSKATRRPS